MGHILLGHTVADVLNYIVFTPIVSKTNTIQCYSACIFFNESRLARGWGLAGRLSQEENRADIQFCHVIGLCTYNPGV